MSVPDPPWKQKTRPCPFYSQGRCLFSDSCNFLHSVKVQRHQDATPISTSAPSSASSSPRSVSETVRFRSPPRSPRMSSLLLALGNAIEPDGEESDEDMEEMPNGEGEETIRIQVHIQSPTQESTTLAGGPELEESLDASPSLPNPFEMSEQAPAVSESTHESVEIAEDHADENVTVTIAPTSNAPITPVRNAIQRMSLSSDGLLSPIQITPAPAICLPTSYTIEREDSVDSGYADGWTGPSPFVMSPPRSPRRASTFSLLSSPFGSPTSRVFSLQPSYGVPQIPATSVREMLESRPPAYPHEAQEAEDLPLPYPSDSTSGSASLESVLDEGFDENTSSRSSSPPTSPERPSFLSEEDEVLDPVGIPDQEDSVRSAADSLSTPESQEREHGLSSASSSATVMELHEDDTVQAVFGEYYSTTPDGRDTIESPSFVAVQEAEASEGTHYTSRPGSQERSDTFGIFSQPTATSRSSVIFESSPRSSLDRSQGETSPEDIILAESPLGDITPAAHPPTTLGSDSPYSRRHSYVSSLSSPYADSGRFASPWHGSDVSSTSHRRSLGSEEELPSGRPMVEVSDAFSPDQSSPLWESSSRPSSSAASRRYSQELFCHPLSSSGNSSPRVQAQFDRPASATSTRSFASRAENAMIAEEGLDRRASTKVPFGFRRSLSERSPSGRRTSGSLPPRRRAPTPLSLRTSTFGPQPEESGVLSPDGSAAGSSGGLRPLRLSMLLNSASSVSSFPLSSIPTALTTGTTAITPSSPSVSSDYSISNNQLLSSPQSNHIPPRNHNTLDLTYNVPHSHLSSNSVHADPVSAPITRPPSWHRMSHSTRSSRRLSYLDKYHRSDSRLSEPAIVYEEDEDEDHQHDDTVRIENTFKRPASSLSMAPTPPSAPRSPIHAIATPRPTLMFALASDNPAEVRRVLESGEAGPNDAVGPQSALAFTLASTQLTHRTEMVKLLLAYGADPSALAEHARARPGSRMSRASLESVLRDESNPMSSILEDMDPATRYWLARAEAPQTRRTSALIHRSFFRPLARVRYDLIGQDRVLEQLFRVLSMPSMAPIVVLLCGPSGHGKSLLARKFGSLLDVPTHTVNMTTLRSTHDIWRSYSMNPYEAPSTCTLGEFLIEQEGKRCVVVLDEIEKVEDEKMLSSLLMPWELGRCSFEAGHRHVDVSQVVWLATSNIGHDLVFEHQRERQVPEAPLSREEYVDLMGLLRPRVSERLGPSLLSRVTTVLPFAPFTKEEKLAIAAEALYALAADVVRTMTPATIDSMVRKSLDAYLPAEGARSLYRAVSTQLLDAV